MYLGAITTVGGRAETVGSGSGCVDDYGLGWGWGGETSSTNPNGAFLTTGLHWTDGVFLMMGGWLEEVSEATVTSGREGGCCC